MKAILKGPPMEKTDFKRTDKAFYSGKLGRFDTINVPTMQFLSINGVGDPNTAKAYGHAVAALYALSYGIKFHCKKVLEKDHVVPPLEGLWWADDMESFTQRSKSNWQWRMMIRQPEWVSSEILAIVLGTTIDKNAAKKDAPTDAETLRTVALEPFAEGPCIQTLHIGSYDDEGPVLHKLHTEIIPASGHNMHGLHHEIYLSDPRRVAPEKLKTLLRQPVAPHVKEGRL